PPSFFYSPAHPRDLHSFPTRRSSDLASSRLTPLRFAVWLRLTTHQSRSPRGRQSRPMSGAGRSVLRTFTPSLPSLTALSQASLPDRKSTRLNSSHLGISYAVFCLKKK